MTRMKAAILGCGQFGHRHAQILLNLSQEIELTAFCDRHPEKAQNYSRLYTNSSATVYSNHRDLIAEQPLDLLVICLPPYGHSDEIEMAAQHGIHLLVEKPISLHSEEAWRMVAVTEAAGIKTQVGFMFRFGDAVEKLKEKIENGEAGLPGLLSARYFCNNLHASWWRDRYKSGGQVVEQVIHMFDLLRYLAGEPVSVYSRQENLFHRDVENYTIEDTSATIISFAQGALGVIYATNNAIPDKWINDYRVVTRNLTADFSDANHAVFHFTNHEPVVSETIASEKDFRLEQTRDLLQAIRNDCQTRTPLREGAKSLDLVLAAVKSADLRQEIEL